MRLRLLCLAVLAVLAVPSAAESASYNTGWFSWLIAGSGTSCSGLPNCQDGPSATSGRFNNPVAVAVGPTGNVYVADYGSGRVRRITPAGALSTMTTTGTFAVDGGGSPEFLPGASGITVADDGTLFVATDGDSGGTDVTDNKVYRVSGGAVTVYAGSNVECSAPDPCGDGGPAAAAMLNDPAGLALDDAGNLYIADAGSNRIRRVAAGGAHVITTVAGSGDTCADPIGTDCDDGPSALAAELGHPLGLAVTGNGSTLYIADTDNHRVRVVSGGAIDTLAGSGNVACSCDDDNNGPADGAQVAVEAPTDIAVLADGSVVIAEIATGRLRQVTAGTITSIAAGFPIGSGQAAAFGFANPAGVDVDADGNLFVVDSQANNVYWLVPSQPLGIPGPAGAKGDIGAKGDKGDAGGNGAGGTGGPKGDRGDRGDQTPLATWVCRKRKHGIGRFAVSCFARVFAEDGSRVRVRLVRGGDVFAADSAVAKDGEARLHLRSRRALRGVYALRLSEQPASGDVRADSIRVAI